MGTAAIGISFLSYAISIWLNLSPFPYYYLLFIFDFIFGLLAYISGDIIYIKYKRSTGEINPIIPEEIKIKISKYRLPFIVALIIVSILIIILLIITLFINRWPLL